MAETKTLEQHIRDDTAMMAEFHRSHGYPNMDFYEELRLHREQCVENLRDSTLADNDDRERGPLYHSSDGDIWRERIRVIDQIAAEEVHSRFTK